MGKSTILDKLVFKSSSEHFFLKINLNTFAKLLKTERLDDTKNVLDFLFENILSKTNKFRF